MDRLKAFLWAVVLSIISIVGIHYYGIHHIAFDPHKMGVWTDDAKFLSREGILKNQDEHTMFVFGSSEFETAADSPYHICNQFQNDVFTPMLIGRGHCQCLQHAITLASVGPELTNKRVVLIIAPQWFRRKSVVKESYALRFSESHYIGMLQNEQIPDKIKGKLIKRTTKLLAGVDDSMLERVELYNRIFFTKEDTAKDRLLYTVYQTFNQEKDRLRVVEKAKFSGVGQTAQGTYLEGEYDWEELITESEQAARENSDNEFYMNQEFYENNQSRIKAEKGKDKDMEFVENSKEYGDLKLFLDVCKSMDIEVLVIVAPFNGYWSDWITYSQEARTKTYQKMCKVAEENGAQVVDLSKEEYNPYFFEDVAHFSGKGWVKFNEAIYEFYKQDNQ